MSRKKFFWIPTLVVSVLGFSIVAMYAYLFTISRHQCFRSSPSPIAWLQQLTNRACGLSLPTRVADSWLSFSAIIVFNDSFLVFSPAPYLRAPPCYGSGEPMPDDATISNGQSPLDPDATLASVGPQAATVAAKVAFHDWETQVRARAVLPGSGSSEHQATGALPQSADNTGSAGHHLVERKQKTRRRHARR